ncbi:MAG: DNA/RNA nuclease SfsA [Alphaproteobacteria bacterium]
MKFDPPLVEARLIRRYKRFLTDAVLPDGTEVTAHCANPGAMLGLNAPDSPIWLQPATNPKRKLKWSYAMTRDQGAMVGCHPALANDLVAEGFANGTITAFGDPGEIRREVKYGQNSRIDFLLGDGTHVEVKNIHLMRTPGLAEFPDCKTARGAKHLGELAELARAGTPAAVLYVVQRADCDRVTVAADLDPAYAQAAQAAAQTGVRFVAHQCLVDLQEIRLGKEIEYIPTA